MNGSRLQQYRRRTPATNWLVLVAILAAIFALSPALSKGAVPDTLEFHGNTGTITYGATVCEADTIALKTLALKTIALLDEWASLVERLEAYQLDGIVRMTAEEAERGQYLNNTGTCDMLASYYNIIITEESNQYVLFQFDPQYGFGEQTYILRRGDFLSDKEKSDG